MTKYQNIVILTGAGLSAESGIKTFRDKDGIWAQVDYRDVATPEGFARNPQLVQDFYNERRRGLNSIKPNAGHYALARLQREHSGGVTIVTQNIDNLHETAGSQSIIHMHGQITRALCNDCGNAVQWAGDLTLDTRCRQCGLTGAMRPDVVWFGEMPYHMAQIDKALRTADLFISIGTSGNVHPAAGFVAEARRAGANCVELNLEPSEGASLFDEAFHGPATQVVPRYIEKLLSHDPAPP